MSALAISTADQVHEVRRPRPGDAIGAALRHAYGSPALSEDMVRLLRRLDRQR